MQRTKNEKGITLVALIITVVVLLILVSVAINSIQNDGILSYAGNVANKYNQAQKDEQGVLDSYLDYLKGDNDWVTIYDGVGTTEDGELLLANKHLFKNGNRYRITVKSDEFSGKVETTAVLYQAASGIEAYILFGVYEGEAITAGSLAEYMTMLEDMGDDAVYTSVIGSNVTQGEEKSSMIAFADSTSEYKVLKIEQKVEDEKDPSIIFEGTITLKPLEETIIPVNSPILTTRKYQVEVLINGKNITLYTSIGPISYDKLISYANYNEELFMLMDGNVIALMKNQECVLKAIYDIGPTDAYFKEEEFEIISVGEEEWILIGTPTGAYKVPETVAGKTVTKVYMDFIDGVPTFERFVNLEFWDTYASGKKVKIDIDDIDVTNNMIIEIKEACSGAIIDLTGYGEELTFTEEVMSILTTDYYTLNVSPAVKAKYPDNANIVVPEE